MGTVTGKVWRIALGVGVAISLTAPAALANVPAKASGAKAVQLKVRKRVPRLYRTRRHDSLQSISQRFGVSESKLRRMNPRLRLIDSDSRLRPGKRVRLIPRRRRYSRYKQMGNGPGYRLLKPYNAWGTELTVTRLRQVFGAYQQRFPTAEPVWIHDLSKRWGGKLKPHKSHRQGRDVDVRVVLNRPTEKYREASPRTLDLEKTWFTVTKLVETGDVQYIFFDYRLQRALYRYARRQGVSKDELSEILQYPQGRHARRGIVRHERGHANHLHVRFRPGKLRTAPTVSTVATAAPHQG